MEIFHFPDSFTFMGPPLTPNQVPDPAGLDAIEARGLHVYPYVIFEPPPAADPGKGSSEAETGFAVSPGWGREWLDSEVGQIFTYTDYPVGMAASFEEGLKRWTQNIAPRTYYTELTDKSEFERIVIAKHMGYDFQKEGRRGIRFWSPGGRRLRDLEQTILKYAEQFWEGPGIYDVSLTAPVFHGTHHMYLLQMMEMQVESLVETMLSKKAWLRIPMSSDALKAVLERALEEV